MRTSIQGDWNLKLVSQNKDSLVCGFEKKDAKLSVNGKKYSFEFFDLGNNRVLITGEINNNRARDWGEMLIKRQSYIEMKAVKLALNFKENTLSGTLLADAQFKQNPIFCSAKITEK